jgi:two-component system sensor histidine kinase KdpD
MDIVGGIVETHGRKETQALLLAQHRLEVDIAGTLPMLKFGAALFEQVLFNVLDNAAKYAPVNTPQLDEVA